MLTAENLISSFARNIMFTKQMTEGFTHADSLVQPPASGNCVNWVIGHIVAYRNRILTILEQPTVINEQIAARYARDSKPVLSDEPGIGQFAELMAALEMSQERLAVGLRSLTPQQAAIEPTFGQFTMSKPEWMLFLLRHEAYHTGQLELLQAVIKQQK
ncbi:hypothetical protein BH10CHL1_BH10CHL1_34160 [soil metagenome]